MESVFKNSIENRFKKMIIQNLVISAFIFLIGIILLFVPELSNKVIGIIIGVIFLITGISLLYKFFKRDGAKLYSLNILFGILDILLGLIIIIYPFSIITFVTICLGIHMVISGALKISYAFWLKKGSEESWTIPLVTGILLILFGFLVMFNPFAKMTLTQLVGAFLIIISVLETTDTILFKKRAKEIKNIFW